MTRPRLPPGAKRVRVDLTLSPLALTTLDAMATHQATTRSALVESWVMRAFAETAGTRPAKRTKQKPPPP
jgi:hypothetical protein